MMQKQLVQLNACQMYLQVTTVAEITDHTGTCILPQAISQKPQIILMGLQQISISLLEWPWIHCPMQPCWWLWTKMICNLLAGSPSNTKLKNLLGHWMAVHMNVWFWKWHISPNRATPTPTNTEHVTQSSYLYHHPMPIYSVLSPSPHEPTISRASSYPDGQVPVPNQSSHPWSHPNNRDIPKML